LIKFLELYHLFTIQSDPIQSNLETKMTFQHQLALLGVYCLSVALVTTTTTTGVVSAEVTPTCAGVLAQKESLGETWYFPNDCVVSCNDLGSTMDLDRSRNVGGNLKCYCVDIAQPFCTDDPYCADLGIAPGTETEDCARVCGEDASDVTATTSVDGNGYQFHYVVNCSCSDGTKQCGDDFILFSDLDYMKSCSGNGDNSLKIADADECSNYCLGTQVFFEGSMFGSSSSASGGIFGSSSSTSNGKNKSCSCYKSDMISAIGETAALACDDATARANDGSGLGNPCYENVGVTKVECPSSSAAGSPTIAPASNSAAKTLVSSAAIMGVWLLPW
jgi:hypothetical protein